MIERRVLGFLARTSENATRLPLRVPLSQRSGHAAFSALSLYVGVECTAAGTVNRLVHLMVSSRNTRDADSGSRR